MALKVLDTDTLELKVNHLKNITILPAKEDMLRLTWSFGAFYDNGDFASELEPINEFRGAKIISRKPNTVEFLPITAVYGGVLNSLYGHFILDTLSRFWFINHLKEDIPIVLNFLNGEEEPDYKLRDFQKQYFDLIGIDINRFIIVKSPICIENLLVPTKGFIAHRYSTPAHFDRISCKSDVRPKTKKVWLSRSKINTWEPVAFTNIIDIENILRDDGWLITYPEELSLVDQLNLLREAKVVAGIEGSALHTLSIVDQIPDLVIIFPRSPSPVGQNYHTVAKHKNMNQFAVYPKTELVRKPFVFKISDPYEPLTIMNNLINRELVL